jgi:hypothetical protein
MSTVPHVTRRPLAAAIPYQVDLSIFALIEHAGLREHIERVGKLFYQR